jgi:hypothetical protein
MKKGYVKMSLDTEHASLHCALLLPEAVRCPEIFFAECNPPERRREKGLESTT